jgi:tetratricopeptide (TPR) repeat protein
VIWEEDLEQAYADLDTAQSLNPLSDWPILVEGEIARQAGDTERAIDAFMRAVAERPEEYAGHYRLAELTRADNPEFAREQILAALALNPIDRRVRALAERLGVQPEPLPD